MDTASNGGRQVELAAIVREIRYRVRAQYPEGQASGLEIPLPNLMPILHARDAAEAKVAAIGSVNPRPSGPLNAVIQGVKRQISRALGWFVRDQVEFNRAAVHAMNATLETLNEVNRSLVAIGASIDQVRQEGEALRSEAGELKDIRAHWLIWRESWEKRLHHNEAHFLHSVGDLNASFEHRVNMAELHFRENLKSQHKDYLAALDKTTGEIQQRLWADLDRIRVEYERLIHYELRLIRQQRPTQADTAPQRSVAKQDFTEFDYTRFAEKFRGSEEYVREGQRFYLPYLRDCKSVLDIGCGRGEFLELMRRRISRRTVSTSTALRSTCAYPRIYRQRSLTYSNILGTTPVRHSTASLRDRLPSIFPRKSYPA